MLIFEFVIVQCFFFKDFPSMTRSSGGEKGGAFSPVLMLIAASFTDTSTMR